MNRKFFQLPEGLSPQARVAVRVLAIFLGVSLVVTGFIAYQAARSSAWQLAVEVVGLGSLLALETVSLFLAWRGRSDAGIWLTFLAWLIVVALTSAMISGLGVVLMISAFVIVTTVAGQTLPPRQAAALSIVSVGIGILAFLTDLFLTTPRIAVPAFGNLVVILVVVLLIPYGYTVITQFRDYSLRTKLIVVSTGAVLAAVGIQAFISIRATTADLTRVENETLLAAAEQAASGIDGHITEELDSVRGSARITDFGKLLETPAGLRDERLVQETTDSLLALIERDPFYIKSFALLDKYGVDQLDTNPTAIGTRYGKTEYFKHALQTGLPYVSPVTFSSGGSELYFVGPIHTRNGQILGMLVGRYDARVLQKWLVQDNGLAGPQSFPILLDKEYHIRLAHGARSDLIYKSVAPLDATTLVDLIKAGRLPDLPADQLSTNLPDFEHDLNNADAQPTFTTTLLTVVAGDTSSGAVASLKVQPWLVGYFEPSSVYLAPVKTQTNNFILFAVIISMIAAFVGAGMAQLLVRPLTRLTTVAEHAAAGNLTAQAAVESLDEIGVLANSFNTMTTRLREFIGSLEARVTERTRNLELAAEVGRAVSQVRDLSSMLTDAAELIRQQFDLYYVQVYLVDPSQTNLILRSGTGDVGKQLLARSHRLALDTASLNGRAAIEKTSVVISDTAASATFRPNALLPDTRSEVAIPLLVGDRAVGVLDMQSAHAGALNEEVLPAFEALAGQLAIAVQNASLLADTEQARADVEKQAARLARANWRSYLDAIHKPEQLGFVYDQNTIRALDATGEQPIAATADVVTAPIAVTGEALGALSVELDKERQTPQTTELVNIVARQVAQQIESLRLIESSERYRAEAEEASRRLTREGWKSYLEKGSQGLGYLYDLNQVRPVKRDSNIKHEASIVDLPLKIRDETVGSLSVTGLDTADRSSVDLAHAVMERLGAHIDGLRLAEQTQSALVQSETLAKASLSFTRAANLQELVADAVAIIDIPVINRAFLAIFNYDDKGAVDSMDSIANWWSGRGQEPTAVGAHLTRDTFQLLPVFTSPEPSFFNDAQSDTRIDIDASELAKRLYLHAVAVLPLYSGLRQIGAMILQAEEPYAFTQTETRLLSALAPQIATVVENRRQFERAQKQAEREGKLNIISQKIQGATTVEAVLQIAARELGQALGAPMTIAQLSLKDNPSKQ